VVDDAITEMRQLVKDASDIDNILIAGGGAFFYKPEIQKAFPKHKILQAEDPLTGVFLRVYYQKGIPEYQVRYRWQRMFEDRRDKMVRSNVYSTPLLTEQERRNVLLQSWSGIAPQGVPGRDYEARDLYVLNEIQGEQVRDRPPPAGLLVGPDRRAVFSIPEEGGTVNLVFEPVEPSAPLPGNSVVGRPFQAVRVSRDGLEKPSYNVPLFAPDAGVVLRWFGKGITQRQTFEVPWNGKETGFQQSLAGGILEVQAPVAAGVRAFLLEGRRPDRKHLPGDREITPELIYVWSYLLHGEAPVDFDVLHDGQEATPVRVVLRFEDDEGFVDQGR